MYKDTSSRRDEAVGEKDARGEKGKLYSHSTATKKLVFTWADFQRFHCLYYPHHPHRRQLPNFSVRF